MVDLQKNARNLAMTIIMNIVKIYKMMIQRKIAKDNIIKTSSPLLLFLSSSGKTKYSPRPTRGEGKNE